MKVGDLVTVKFDNKGWYIPDNTDSMLWILLEIAPSNEVLVYSPQTGYKCWTRKRWAKVVE
jgi:hypothetical protein